MRSQWSTQPASQVGQPALGGVADYEVELVGIRPRELRGIASDNMGAIHSFPYRMLQGPSSSKWRLALRALSAVRELAV